MGRTALDLSPVVTGMAATGAWGVLGGTFDPIHYAHLAIAERCREDLGLAGILFMPSGVPPHKGDQQVTPALQRAEMVELAIAGNPRFSISRVEIDRPGVSYTVETLQSLIGERADLVFILSVEALLGLPTWREPNRILELCRLAVVPRWGFTRPDPAWLAERFPGLVDRIAFLDGPDLGNSASDIRLRAGAGHSIRYLVPDAVADYIERHHLYRGETH